MPRSAALIERCHWARRACLILVLLLGLLGMSCVGLAQSVSPPDFSIVALPDTQMYAQDYPANFTAQTQWIVNNWATLNIKFVVGLGDIVNVGNSDTQWLNAKSSIDLLDNAGIPYALGIGNHDYDESDAWTRISTYYNKYNGIAHYQGRSYYGASTYPPGQNDNFYALMPINGDTYLFLMIEYWPRDGALDWARTVLAAYPSAKVIVVTHGYEGTDNFRTGPHDCGGPTSWGGDNNGEDMWSSLVSQYANIIMVLNGHLPSAPGREFDPGVNGNLVNQIVADYQDDPNGGNGWLRVLTFHPTLHTVDVKTYSPTLNLYQVDMGNQFTVPLDTQGLDPSQAGIRGRVRAISTGCSTDPVNGIVSYALGTAAPAYLIPDANGYYTTPTNLAPGTYTVKANAPGYAPAVSSVPVAPGYTTPARLYLSTTTNEYTLSATPASQTVNAGSGATFSTTLSSAGTYANAQVTLSAIGLPSGASASFSPPTLTGAGVSSMTVSTTSGAVSGTYPFLISGDSGDMQRTASATLVVAPPPDFSVASSPASVAVAQGAQSTSTLTSTIVGSFNAGVTLTASGLPAGVTASFSANPISAPGSGSSVLTFIAASGATLGTSTVTVTASGGGKTHTANISLTVVVPPDFSLAASPTSVTVNPGKSGTSTTTTAITGLFNSSVALSVSGLPRKVTATFSPSSIAAPGSGSSTLTLSAAANAPLGNSTITITGSGGGKTRTATVNLAVTSLVATPPTAVSVTPSSGSGLTQTFSFQFSDANGYSAITETQTIINGSLNYAGGCVTWFSRATNAVALLNDAGTSWGTSIVLGTNTTLQNSQCSLNVGASSVSGSGNTFTENLAITFAAGFTGTKNIYADVAATGGLDSGWQTLGTWTPATLANTPPAAVSVTPSSGSGLTRTFSFQFSDVNGYSAITETQTIINSSLNYAGGCVTWFSRATNAVALLNDAGTSWGTSVVIGTNTTLQNSQCSLNVGASSVSGSGNTFTENLAITFAAGFTGTKNIYASVAASGGLDSGWQTLGTWTPAALVNTPPQAVSVTPSSGSGLTQTFSFQFSDVNGYSTITETQTIINGSLTYAGCVTWFNRATNAVALLNDAGTSWGTSVVLGTNTTLQNSQCSLNVGASSVSGSSNTLTENLAITFAAGFTGTKNVYAYVAAAGGLDSGWHTLGTWNVP